MPRLADLADLTARVADAPVARLATLRTDGTPRLVPITFALVDGLVCSAVDAVKAKSSARLARLDDVRRDPRVAVLVDRYAQDWTQLWWVRIDGTATVVEEHPAAAVALRAKYPPYRGVDRLGPFLVVTPLRWVGWSAVAPVS